MPRRAHVVLTLEALSDLLQVSGKDVSITGVTTRKTAAVLDEGQVALFLAGDGLPEECETPFTNASLDSEPVSLIYSAVNMVGSRMVDGAPRLERIDIVPRGKWSALPNSGVIYVMAWTEIEPGWGQRPDGISVHPSLEAVAEAVKAEVKRANERTDRSVGFSVAAWDKPRRIYVEPGSEIETLLLTMPRKGAEMFYKGMVWADKALEAAINEHLRQ